MTTYIPIALLIMFCKIFEKVACNRLNKHIHINNVLVPEQNGFRNGLSTGKAAC